MPRPIRPPKYRLRNVGGREIAVVTLRDQETGTKHDVRLGEYGSEASRAKYLRALDEWERAGRRYRPAARPGGQRAAPTGLTVASLTLRYFSSVPIDSSDRAAIRSALRVLNQVAGDVAAVLFGPRLLRTVRMAMIRGDAARGRPPWTRKSINRQVHRVRAVFRWAVAHELLPSSVYEALRTLEPLRAGRTPEPVRESDPVLPVPDAWIQAVRARVSRECRALIDLQLLTGARPGELINLRLCDIDRSGAVWCGRPGTHKTSHLGRQRAIWMGPRAQEIVEGLMAGKGPASYLFSPAAAEAERMAVRRARRKTPAGLGNGPGTNRRERPRRTLGERYTVASYRRAVQRACDAAFPPPEELARRRGEPLAAWRARLTTEQREQLAAWRRAHRWHPHQLRHNAATELRRKYGLEAARVLLGHSSAAVTDAVYAERDAQLAMRVAAEAG